MSESDKVETPERSRRLLIIFASVVAVPAILMGAGWLYLDHHKSIERRPWKCGNYLRQVAGGVMHYYEAHGEFPPPYTVDESGKKLHSWRTLILPFMDHHVLYEQLRLDEPWDSPHNRSVENRYALIGNEYGDLPRDQYHCPSDPEGDEGQPLDASYFVVTGPGTAWQHDRKVTLADMVDGAANTIMVIDVADSGVHWMEPRDFHIDEIPLPAPFTKRRGITSHHVSKETYLGNAGDLVGYQDIQPEGGNAVTFSGNVFSSHTTLRLRRFVRC
tara:strand:+ start:35747 stop:36565 length:819 start_codon:yes stop_codon:yes gene_type:complete